MTVSSLNLSVNPASFSSKEQEWLEKSATELAQLLAQGHIKSVDLVTTFLKQADNAHKKTNCITEAFEQQALKRAHELDDHLASTGETVGILHGLPVSVKEHIHMEDTISSAGYRAWAQEKSTQDALIVEQMRKAGAIIICKTTNPQTLLALETDSNVFGRTLNAHNSNLTSGGSSGGEGALLALNGSTLGIGTDIGGSIRTPSAFNGVYGLKPSVGRLPHSGLVGNHAGMENVVGVVGPLARSPSDLSLFCQAALAHEPWHQEQAILPMPWRTNVSIPEKLCFAFIRDDGLVRPQPPVIRALDMLESKLKAAGHDVIHWDMIEPKQTAADCMTELLQDGGKELIDLMADDYDPPVPIVKWILDNYGGRSIDRGDSWKLNVRRNNLIEKHNKRWNNTVSEITGRVPDAIISPAHPSPAPPHNHAHHWNYTMYWNQLDATVGVLPVTTVNEKADGQDGAIADYRSDIEREYHEGYKPETYKNAPVAVQVIGRRLQEEFIVGVMEKVNSLL